MRIRNLLIALLLVGAPATAFTQQNTPGASRQRTEQRTERRGPVQDLLRDRQILGLTDEQVARLREVDQRMDDLNRPLVQKLIEIHRAMADDGPRVPPDQMTPEQREAFRRWVAQARPLLHQIRENNRATMREVGKILTAEQRSKIREMLRRRHDDDEHSGPSGSRSGRRH